MGVDGEAMALRTHGVRRMRRPIIPRLVVDWKSIRQRYRPAVLANEIWLLPAESDRNLAGTDFLCLSVHLVLVPPLMIINYNERW